MNVFRRIGDIVSSNVNSLLDKMEDPEKMIDLSIKELEDSVLEMKAIYAEKTSELKNLERGAESARGASTRWEERAKLAIAKNEDEMAKEACAEKLRWEEKAKRLEESIQEIKIILSSLNDSRIEAEKKLDDMRVKSSELKVRAKSAKEKKKVAEITNSQENARFDRRLAEISAKIDKWEAYSSDSTPLYTKEQTHKSYEKLEEEDAIEKELERLKSSN